MNALVESVETFPRMAPIASTFPYSRKAERSMLLRFLSGHQGELKHSLMKTIFAYYGSNARASCNGKQTKIGYRRSVTFPAPLQRARRWTRQGRAAWAADTPL